jgi:bacillithiol biosynthesis cysteine-adding enzyme BshC
LKAQAPSLAHDYLHDFEKVSEFFKGDFRDASALQDQIGRVGNRPMDRGRLAAVLKTQNQKYGCSSRTFENIDRLAEEGSCAVVTGQQVGLFSGPLYTVYKALTAIRLAENLERIHHNGCVPVFWMASDDHDSAEIDHIHFPDKENQIRKLSCRSQGSESRLPAAQMLLGPDIEDCLRFLHDSTHESEFKFEIFAELQQAYTPGRSFVDAFAMWMTRLFQSYGLVFVDATHPDLKDLGKSVFLQEISQNSPSTEQALAVSERLKQAGYEVQVPLHPGILNLFLVEHERQSLHFQEGKFLVKGTGQTFCPEDLLKLAHSDASLFSPNALLRPLYQDTLLPTAVYVGGPGEIGYFAQLKGVYESFGLAMPLVYPRKNLTLLEKSVERILDAHQLQIDDLDGDVELLINALLRKDLPGSLDKAFGSAVSHLEQDFLHIREQLAVYEPTLDRSVQAALGKIKNQIEILEKKAVLAAKKRNSTVVRQLHKLKANLYPNNRPQERVFSITSYLIKYGESLIDRLYQEINLSDLGHQVIRL